MGMGWSLGWGTGGLEEQEGLAGSLGSPKCVAITPQGSPTMASSHSEGSALLGIELGTQWCGHCP